MSGTWELVELAAVEVEAIVAYVRKDSGEAAADRLVRKFIDAFDLLAHSPRMGIARPALSGPNVRCWTVFKYLVVYDPSTKPLQILRVVHGAQDLSAVLGTDT